MIFDGYTLAMGGIEIDGYTVVEVNNTKGLGAGYTIGKFDGICGMGWDDISVDNVETPLRALVNSGRKLEADYCSSPSSRSSSSMSCTSTYHHCCFLECKHDPASIAPYSQKDAEEWKSEFAMSVGYCALCVAPAWWPADTTTLS